MKDGVFSPKYHFPLTRTCWYIITLQNPTKGNLFTIYTEKLRSVKSSLSQDSGYRLYPTITCLKQFYWGTMERFDCLSTNLYYRVNNIIGDRELVSIRRDGFELSDTFHNSSQDIVRRMISGSQREGLDMKSSDFDQMLWSPNVYVIWDTTQSHYYNTATDTLILAEHGVTRPGFVLLRLLHQVSSYSLNTILLPMSCISLHNNTYISSSRYKQLLHEMLASEKFDLHGPCLSAYKFGRDGDIAFCFHCLHWPPKAFSWLQRCQRLCWPRPSVLQDITHSGCHFVAIGAQQSIFENVEWRLSFSQAEQKLIYSFNQCQFLVYGLLKLFLKEVLNSGIPENQKLLCSYFMKTALFWQIQDDILIHWSVDNFLSCFWNCFKLLIKWVNCQYCPNFFVPENNMFFPKITGRNQQRLLSQLLSLYNEGVVCLLRCASIKDKFVSSIFYPHHTLNHSYELHLLEIKKDFTLHRSLPHISYMKSYTYEDYIKCIHFLMMKFRSSITQAQRLFFYKQIIHQCQRLALFQQMTRIHGRGNVEMYTLKKQSLNLLKQTSRLGFLTDVIYLVMYYYIEGRYTQALCLLQELKYKLYRPYVMPTAVCPEIYQQAMGGKSLSSRIKEAFANQISILDFANLSELRLEHRLLEQSYLNQFSSRKIDIMISPFVFVHFLIFLCYHHLDSTLHRQQALHDLHTLVHRHKDDDWHIKEDTQHTAWLLLGICHQMNQNPEEALQCYRKSLEKNDWDQFVLLSTTTHYRIKCLERQTIQQCIIIEPPLD